MTFSTNHGGYYGARASTEAMPPPSKASIVILLLYQCTTVRLRFPIITITHVSAGRYDAIGRGEIPFRTTGFPATERVSIPPGC